MLIFSLLGLVVGPLLHRMARGSRHAMAGLDGFTLVAISGLVLLHIMPEGVHEAGWLACGTAALGFFLPSLLERWLHSAADRTHRAALVLAMSGLALHAALDGAALAQPGHHLALAVVLHRLPVGLAIWLLLGSSRGHKTAVLTLAAVATATVIGFSFGGALPRGTALAAFESLVGGSLMHVVIHRNPVAEAQAGWRIGGGLGALLGVALLFWLGYDHDHESAMGHSGAVFLRLASESAGPLLLAYLGASMLHAFLPQSTMAWLGRGPLLLQAAKGMAFGLPLPICSCGVVPLYRGMIEKGAPAAAAIAFLVATPEIGIDAVLLSLPFLGLSMTLIRIAAAATVALSAGALIGRLVPAPPDAHPRLESARPPWPQRLGDGLSAGFGGLVDNTAAWIILGLAVAAVGSELLDPRWLSGLPRGADIVLLTLLGVPTYVCASGATPLVGMLLAKGVSPGAGLAFLLTGPATNATTFGVLSQLHGRKLALWFGLLVGGLAMSMGLAVNTWAGVGVPTLVRAAPHSTAHAIGPLLWPLALLFGLSLLRQGPRGFWGHVFPMARHSHDHGDHDHGDHDHGDHDHGGHSEGAGDRGDPRPTIQTCEKPSCGGCCH